MAEKKTGGDFALVRFLGDASVEATSARARSVAAAPTAADVQVSAPLAPSLLNPGQSSVPASPILGLVPPASRPSPTVELPAAGTVSALPAGAADAVFAPSHPATQDDAAWLFAPLVPNSLDVM